MKKFVAKVPSSVGKTAIKLFFLAAIPVMAQAIYLIHIAFQIKNGSCPLNIFEIKELITGEALALALTVGGTLLMDLEERTPDRD